MLNQEPNRNFTDQSEIDIIDILRTLLHYRKLASAIALIGTTSSIAISLMLPNTFTATATLMPIEQNNSSKLSMALGSLGGALGMLPSQAGLGVSASDKFVTLLETRTLAESVINNQNLMPTLFKDRWDITNRRWKEDHTVFRNLPPSMQDGVESLKELVTIKTNKQSGVVSISVTSKEADLSARIANAYLGELNTYLLNNSLSASKRNRIFIEEQLRKAQKEMGEYEISLKDFQQKNRVLSLDAQTEASVKTYSDLKAKLMASEVELSLLEKSSLDGDPRSSLKRQEVEELRKQLNKFESGSSSGPIVSFQQAPSLGLSYARLKRELMVREKVFEMLTQQYEMAKIQEAQEDISFQVLDTAVSPERKSGPKRLIIIIIGALTSIVLGAFAALAKNFWVNNRVALVPSSRAE